MSNPVFVLLGQNDSSGFTYTKGASRDSDIDLSLLFRIYAAVDVVEDLQRTVSDAFLGKLELPSGESYSVSAFVGIAPLKLLVLHTGATRIDLNQFFTAAYGVAVKHLLNPFCNPTCRIRSPQFNKEMISLCDRYL